MKRKVIKQGHSTLTITLPSKWVKKFDIKAGDELDLIEQKKSIVLNTQKVVDIGEISIDVSDLPTQLLWRFIISSYRAGYDKIKVTFENKGNDHKKLYTAFSYNTIEYLSNKKHLLKMSQIETIQALVNRLIGMEIIDQKKNYCIIKEMGEISYKEFDNSLRRIFLLIKDMSSQIQESFKGDKSNLKSVHIVDTNLDRFEDFCLRVLNKKGYSDFNKTPIVFSTIFLLELIGDEYKDISISLLSTRSESKEFIQALDNLIDLFNKLYILFYKFDKEKVKEIYKNHEEWNLFNKKISPDLNAKEKEMIHHLKNINDYIKSLTELKIDLET
jgi:phosphate uptake regulator